MAEIPHGTYSGYRLHYYYGGKPCATCVRAKREYTRAVADQKRNGLLAPRRRLGMRCAAGLGWPEEPRR